MAFFSHFSSIFLDCTWYINRRYVLIVNTEVARFGSKLQIWLGIIRITVVIVYYIGQNRFTDEQKSHAQ